jgi:metal-responsive CopG/Arc/MetJ family transcriptional regulator
MALSKITISLPSELVAQIDRLASAAGESRSLIVREAAVDYVAASMRRGEAAQRAVRQSRAMESLEALRQMPRSDTRTSEQIIAELRASVGGSAPGAES